MVAITFDLKGPCGEQLLAEAALKELLLRFPRRMAQPELTTLRFFCPAKETAEILRLQQPVAYGYAIGIPNGQGTDGLELLQLLEPRLVSKLAGIYVSPSQLDEAVRWAGSVPLVCDIGNEEILLLLKDLNEVLPRCLQANVRAIHTGRVAAALQILGSPATTVTEEVHAESVEGTATSMWVLSQANATSPVQVFSTVPALHESNAWTRCAGKLATALLVMRLVELKILPGLDQPMIGILDLSGQWFPNWKQHPVMKNLTLRHVMAGVGGLPMWRWLPEWVTKEVRSPLELAERALSHVEEATIPGSTFVYSNMQWAVVELAIERRTRMDFPTAARRFLFDPLGISEQTYYRSEDRSSCAQSPETSVFERNLRAGIGLCATAYDLFLLGATLRQSCKACLLSPHSFREVVTDQLAVHFPSAVPSFQTNAPATDFAQQGLRFTGRGFAGYHLGPWLLAHGGLEGFLGQNVLMHVAEVSEVSDVMVTWISGMNDASGLLQAFAKELMQSFLRAPGSLDAKAMFDSLITTVQTTTTTTTTAGPTRAFSGLPPCGSGATVVVADARSCTLPFKRQDTPQTMGLSAEARFNCVLGRRRWAGDIDRPVRQSIKCPIESGFWKLDSLLNACPANASGISDSARLASMTAKCFKRPSASRPARVCRSMSACASAWNAINENQWHRRVDELPRIVLAQHKLMQIYTTPIRDAPQCSRFPLPPCGGMKPHWDLVDKLEPLFPDLRNLWYHAHATLIDFTPYLPLPALANFSNAKRRILIVVGANRFCRAPKYLMDMYSPYFDFDQIHLVDAHALDVPSAFLSRNITTRQMTAQVATRDDADIFAAIPSWVTEDDFVALMWDTDFEGQDATLEWGILADLLSMHWKLVDELFIETHFTQKAIGWTHTFHGRQEAYELLYQLRHHCGFAIHAWP
ncbi:unnamed protein product [Effrenium voratum]|nr:unnamed protein product [Effrenium voratum]